MSAYARLAADEHLAALIVLGPGLNDSNHAQATRRKDLPDSPAIRQWAARNARSPGEKSREAELRYVKLVFVAEGSLARARPVETGLSDEQRVEILSGLEAEDRVIVGPFRALDELKDGDPIIPVGTAAELGSPG